MKKNYLNNNLKENDRVIVLGCRNSFLHGKVISIKSEHAEILIEESVHLFPKNKIYKNIYNCGDNT